MPMDIVRIVSVKKETQNVKTIYFEWESAEKAQPGQFVMVWIPGVDEIPLSLSNVGSKIASVTVKMVGNGTAALHQMNVGDMIGIRGPYGRSFAVTGDKVLIVAGGVGMAPILPLIREVCSKGCNVTVVAGFKSSDEIIFRDYLESSPKALGIKVYLCTEDGSLGIKGTALEVARKILKNEVFDCVYVCGKETLIRGVFDESIRKGIEIQASLERYMRCGVGLCGSCVLGEYLVCRDGPVFDTEMLKNVVDELGNFKRDECGRKTKVL